MKLVGLMPVRNEDWIIGLSLRVALLWCDSMVVLSHACTDFSNDLLHQIELEYPGRLTILHEEDAVWREMQHRQQLLDAARMEKATHIALIDADEVLTGNLLKIIRNRIETVPPGKVLLTRMYALWRGIHQYRDDQSVWSNRKDFSLAFRDTPALCWRTRDGYDHHHRVPFGAGLLPSWLPEKGGGVMHLQFVDWRRLTAKHAFYKISERIRWPQKSLALIDKSYSMALDETGLKTTLVPASWWLPYEPFLRHLHLDREPWQEKACREAVALHGKKTFQGLNLFGIA